MEKHNLKKKEKQKKKNYKTEQTKKRIR